MDFPKPKFHPLKPADRPQDPTGDCKGWTFRTLEHGGSEPDSMPEVIEATDAEGRKCLYVPLTHEGKIGRWE